MHAGFDVADAIALLRLDDLYVEVFEVKDVKVTGPMDIVSLQLCQGCSLRRQNHKLCVKNDLLMCRHCEGSISPGV